MTFPQATLAITLSDTDVARTVTVPHDIPLAGLHAVVQAAMGWQDSHLHMFRTDRGGQVWTNWVQEPERERDENEGTLRELAPVVGATVEYIYDYGDGWHHRLEVTALDESDERRATLVDARGTCPPEDFGGPHVFTEFLGYLRTGEGDLPIDPQGHIDHYFGGAGPAEVLQRLNRPDLAELRVDVSRVRIDEPGITGIDYWPREFREDLPLAFLARKWNSPALAHLLVKAFAAGEEPAENTAADATALTRWFLDFVGDGLPLTQAGYLKPADTTKVVEHIQRTEPDRFIYISKERKTSTFRESETLEVLFLREMLMAAGLLRKHKGRLVPVASRAKLKDRTLELARHLAASLFVPEQPDLGDEIVVVVLVNLLLDDPAITDRRTADTARVRRLDQVFRPLLRMPEGTYHRTVGEYVKSLAGRHTRDLELLGLMKRHGYNDLLNTGGRALVAEIARLFPTDQRNR